MAADGGAAAVGYGVANILLTTKLHRSISVSCTALRGHSYVFGFHKNDAGLERSFWRCTSCRSLYAKRKQGAISRMSVSIASGVILSDPEDGHDPLCAPTADAVIAAEQLLQQGKQSLREGRKRPLPIYNELYGKIAEKFTDDEEYNSVVDSLPPYKAVRRSLYRSALHGLERIEDPANLPAQYSETYRTASPDAGQKTYLELHKRILGVKEEFHSRTGCLWDVPNFSHEMMTVPQFQYLCREIYDYLTRVRHFVGKEEVRG